MKRMYLSIDPLIESKIRELQLDCELNLSATIRRLILLGIRSLDPVWYKYFFTYEGLLPNSNNVEKGRG